MHWTLDSSTRTLHSKTKSNKLTKGLGKLAPRGTPLKRTSVRNFHLDKKTRVAKLCDIIGSEMPLGYRPQNTRPLHLANTINSYARSSRSSSSSGFVLKNLRSPATVLRPSLQFTSTKIASTPAFSATWSFD